MFRMQPGSSTYLRSEKISEVALKHIFYSFHVFNPIIVEIFKHVDRFSTPPLNNSSMVEVSVMIPIYQPVDFSPLEPSKLFLVQKCGELKLNLLLQGSHPLMIPSIFNETLGALKPISKMIFLSFNTSNSVEIPLQIINFKRLKITQQRVISVLGSFQ